MNSAGAKSLDILTELSEGLNDLNNILKPRLSHKSQS